MFFVDRVAGQPNRYALTTEEGNTYYVTLERADNPITEGTPLNAETFNDMVYDFQELVDAFDRSHQTDIANLNSRLNKKDALYIESTEYPGCYYRMVSGEKEWVNPPMAPDVEYRTTERAPSNQVVYTKQFILTEMPGDAQTTSIPIGSESRYYDIVCNAYIQELYGGNWKCFPIINGGFADAWLEISNGNTIVIRTRTGVDFSGYLGYITLKYTK